MEVSLRKGHKLAQELIAKAECTEHSTTLSLALYTLPTAPDAVTEEVKARAVKALDDLLASAASVDAMISSAYTIRRLLGAAFQTSGISDLLAEKAMLERSSTQWSQLASNCDAGADPDHAAGKIAEARAAAASPTPYSRNAGDVTFRIAGPVFIEKFREKAHANKRRIVEIDDKLLHLNMSTHIALPESVVEVLKANKLI